MLRMGGEEICIFDLDGTLADDSHRAHYLHPTHLSGCPGSAGAPVQWGPHGMCLDCGVRRDWDKYFGAAGDDRPKESVIKVCNDLARWHKIYILSGRSKSTEDITRKWLHDHQVVYDKLMLREVEDRTQDDQLKLRWVGELGIGPKILCVFEDRNRVVEAWRAAGFTCFQVAIGNF